MAVGGWPHPPLRAPLVVSQKMFISDKKYATSLLVSSAFNHFFPNMLFGHIFVPPPGRGGGQTEKYTPLYLSGSRIFRQLLQGLYDQEPRKVEKCGRTSYR